MLKKYNTNQKERIKKEPPTPSGVACDEKKCSGEMMIGIPVVHHPELKELRRAECGVCKWKGWV